MTDNLQPIKSNFIFEFTDAVNNKGQFEQTTVSNIKIAATVDASAKGPRWVKVLYVGPDCKWLKPGEIVLLPALQWTEAFKLNDKRMWISTERTIVARYDEGTIKMVNEYVAFDKKTNDVVQLNQLIYVVSASAVLTDTVNGIVTNIDPKVTQCVVGDHIHLYDPNFFDTVDVYGSNNRFSFVKQSKIDFIADQ